MAVRHAEESKLARTALVGAVLIAQCVCGSARAEGNSPPEPYCGIACVYLVARIQGKQVEFVDLLKPEYVGNRQGSTLRELRKCVEDVGFHAQEVQNLSFAFLRRTSYPIILHVKKDPSESRIYNHYVLFLGVEGKLIRILDPPGPLQYLRSYELAQRWNRKGLLLSRSPIDADALVSNDWLATFASVALGIALISLLIAIIRDRIERSYPPESQFSLIEHAVAQLAAAAVRIQDWTRADRACRRRFATMAGLECMVILALAAVAAILFHRYSQGGLLNALDAARPVQELHRTDFLKRIGKNALRKAIDAKNVLLVDARQARDFGEGAIDSAMNIPAGSSANDILNQLRGVSRDTPIVVYCQSSSCPYASILAQKLLEQKYDRISIYRGGWNEWQTGASPAP